MKPKNKIAVIGTHGYNASYGGFETLVKQLVDNKTANLETHYKIYNCRGNKEAPIRQDCSTVNLPLKASGLEGVIYDFISIIHASFTCNTLLLLGPVPIVFALIAKILRLNAIRVIVNVGGLEWERPRFGNLAKRMLKTLFYISAKHSDTCILDNAYFLDFLPNDAKIKRNCRVIPYGGVIDYSIKSSNEIVRDFPFLNSKFFLSINRSNPDNFLKELIETFVETDQTLVLISNFSNSDYGKDILAQHSSYKNIYLIDGLYEKPRLDAIRRSCFCYIHTQTLCGSAPSLIEMIVCEKPILSIDLPQNRFTLNSECQYFQSYEELRTRICSPGFDPDQPSSDLVNRYNWRTIALEYEALF